MQSLISIAADLSWPFAITLAWVVGEFGHRWTGLPRISFYGVIGFVLAQTQVGVLPQTDAGPMLVLADVAFGLILFEVGYRINLRWLKNNPWIAVTGLVESLLTFAVVYFIGIEFGSTSMTALLLASLAMSTSPATIMRVINEERSSGQVTERIVHLTALNCVLAVFTFNIIVGFWMFQSSTDLIEAMFQVHATSTRQSLPLYLSCADGALLRFVVRDPRFVGYGDELKLRLRLLRPADFIQRMRAAGVLTVLVSSVNWPQGGATQGGLGPIHAHADDAVGYVHGRIGRFSGTQYLGALLENPAASSWVAVMPVADTGFPCAMAPRLFTGSQWPEGYRLCAAHLVFHAGLDQPHSVAEDPYREYFVSWRELAYYIHQLTRDGLSIDAFYLSARDGALLRYTPRFSDAEYNLLATTGKWSEEHGYTQFAPEPSWVIAELARIGELRVVHAGSFWARRGALGQEGLPQNGVTPGAPEKDEL